MLKTYQSCPKKFWYKYVERVNIPISSRPFEKGKKIHALANYYLQGVNISRIETALTQTERAVWQKLVNNPYFQKQPLKTEYQISCKIGDFWVGGRLDAVVHDFENYYILDYKTGAVPKTPQYDFQTMIYLLSLDRILKTYNELSFVYIDLKNDKNCVIKFDNDIKKVYEDKVAELCSCIKYDTACCRNCTNCPNCEYKKLCENQS